MFQNPAPPGRVKWFATPTSSPVIVTASLITPTNLAHDEKTNAIYITEMFTGRILKLSL
jgi:hypothetical protein